MDFYQSVVAEYLQRDRGCFLNTEFYLVNRKLVDEPANQEWFVDIVAIDLRYGRIWLCEISYARNLSALVTRLTAWAENWDDVRARLRQEAHLIGEMNNWPIYVWAFVPDQKDKINRIAVLEFGGVKARMSTLEEVAPWLKNRWPKDWNDEENENQLVRYKGYRFSAD